MDLTSIAEKVSLAFRDNRLDWYSEAYGDLQALWVQAREACNRDREGVCLYMIKNFPHNAHELSEFLDFVNGILTPMMSCPALYTIDADGCDSEESWTLEQIILANEPAWLEPESVAEITALKIGEKLSFGGGAWAEWIIRRVA